MSETPIDPAAEPSGGFFSRRRNQVIVGCGALLVACVGVLIAGAIISVIIDDDDEDPTATSVIAAQPTATEDDSEAEEPTAAPTETAEPGEPTSTPAPTATDAPAPTATEDATNTPAPTNTPAATATPEPEDLQILDFGFGQEPGSRSAGWGVIIENPNGEHGVERSDYQIAFLDENDVVIETESGFVELVLPGQRIGIAGTAIVDEGVQISSMQVQVLTGSPIEVSDEAFIVESPVFYPDDFAPRVAGIVNNPSAVTITDLRISTITFDEAGQINGGGFTFLELVPASGRAVSSHGVDFNGTVASAEMFAMITILSDRIEANPDTDVQVANFGYGSEPDRDVLGWAALITNPTEDMAVIGSRYHVSFYDSEGRPLADDSGFVEHIFPGATTAIGSDFVFLPDGIVAASMDVAFRTGELRATQRLDQFIVENVTFVDEGFSASVTGIVRNPYDEDFENLDTVAVAYDEAGNIIGGGSSFLDFLLAQGQSAAEVGVTVAGTPATVELYVNPSILTEFE